MDAQRELDKRNDQELKDWVLSLRAGPSIRIVLKRIFPKKSDDGTPVVGKCDEYDEPVSEDDIRDRHGGGKYEVIVHKPNVKSGGGWQFFKQATIEIPGEPDFTPVLGKAKAKPQTEGASAVDRTMTMAERMLEDSRKQLEVERNRSGREGGFDIKAFEIAQAPLLESLREEREARRTLETRVTTLMQSKPDNSFQERIVEKMTDGASQQLQTLRAQHDSELRTLRENNYADMKRLEDRHEKTLDRLVESHRREIAGLERAHDQQAKATEQAFNSRIEQLKSDSSRLERELSSKDTELARLRAMKEKSPLESMQDAVAIKEQLVELGLAKDHDEDDEDDDKIPGWVKGVTAIFDNPIAAGIAERIAGGAPPAAKTPEQVLAEQLAALPVGKAVELPDGRIVAKRADGQIVAIASNQAEMLQKRKALLNKKRAAAHAASTAAGQPPPVDASGNPVAPPPPAPPLRIAKEDLAKVVRYIEGAIGNGTTPEQFAASAATMAPKGVMHAIRKQTVEWFLEQAEVDDTSAINTQGGRDWLRQLSAVLKGPV